MRTKFNGILTLLLALIVQISFAQDKTISGNVSDESGPLPGVTILKKGTTQGTESDFDGNYSLKAKTGDILVFSFVGMKTKEVAVGASNQINVVLENDNLLEEVVVVAYGTQSRNSVTGTVAVVDQEQVENATFSNPVKSLEGLAPGLRVIQASGQPGSDPIIRVRGFGSINASSAPLIVLDGVPYNGSLSSINPKDIESTSVLKDASSTSLYGNKASNGVLLITTKKGSRNKTQINIDSRFGITQRAAKEYNIIDNPGEFYESYHSIIANSEYYRQNANGTPITIAQARQFASNNLIPNLGYNVYNVADNQLIDPLTGKLNSSAQLQVVDKWEDALFRDAATFQANNVSISGGSEDVTYYISLGSEKNNGYTVRSNFERHNARVKASSAKIFDAITLSGDISYSNTFSQGVPATLSAAGVPTTNFNNAFFWNRRIAPIYPVYKYDQNWNPILEPNNPSGFAYDLGQPQFFPDGTSRGARNYAPGEHPLAAIEQATLTTGRDNFNGGLRTKIDLPFDIKFEYVMNYLTETDKDTNHTGKRANVFADAQNGLLTSSFNRLTAFTNQQLLTWKKEFGRNSFDVLLGHETYTEKFSLLSISKRNLIGDINPVIDNTSVYASSAGHNRKYATEGYFSRFIYGLDNTYFLNLTARRDASSVFHPDHRWGTFWSAGASWVLSNEDFLSSSDAINYAKLAVNYGTTGNDRLLYPTGFRNYAAYEDQSIIGESNGQLTSTLTFLGTRDITWEKSKSLDVALELGLFDKVNLSLGYYRKETTDLLFNSPLSLINGQPSKPENSGSMLNSGLEAQISWKAVDNDNFKVNFNANIATLNNEVLSLPNDNLPQTTGNFRREVGKSIFDYYMVEFAGVNPDNGNAQYYAYDTTSGDQVVTEDINDAITRGGRVFTGKQAIPDFTGGFGTNIEYGNFNLGLQFAYQVGGYGIDNEYFGLLGTSNNVTNFPDYDKTWTYDNTTAKLPRIDPDNAVNQYALSDLWLTDLSYLSLNNISLSYNLSNDVFKKYHIDNVRFYGTINNAFLLYSARQGYDPRLNSVGSSSAEYGANRTIAFGVNINLN